MKLWIYPLMVVFAASSYGTLSTMVKLAIGDGYTASEAISSQYIVGFLLALVIYLLTQRKLPRLYGGFKIILLAGVFTATTGIVYGMSLIYLPASLAVVMLFQFTWIGTLIDCIIRKRLPSRAETISLIILFLGTILAAGILDVDLSGIDWRGWVYGFAAAVSFSLNMNVNTKQVEGMNTTTRLLFVSFIAALMISFFQSPEIMWNGKLFTEPLLFYGLALGLLGIIIPIYFFVIAVPKVGGAVSSILSAMELPVAVIVSVLVLSEALSWLQILGIVVILVGMCIPTLATISKNKKRQTAL
ncbi:Threonine/homoserine efflux transporter RhtA [Paenisporosarcina quisquiliarum]|jgi:drug/metabolite transporter (DMT)-like permease|uniref:DMT family transporter n=1 Tax=Psychrobacillus psychrodurans TaxID=126157 RepID=A0A9X3LBU1_9BACI|nr:DMT family transporter [Psychrobacillus psychrodurans]SEN91330.1 Threonine/homoserine efflux transporter RhtA [Paenisporosarcina quisquiliarum]MCK1999300.1 DMT family transporter [Psychrobacillus psychrodurans]MCZ8535088.1 DMT family transporter [Psychrobacillus psychrodurans]MCZ8540871.1 DMT family transporter [Psychrobacillus psychrodurans]SFM77575.1 Threonine/homoserine efflux transporter RhtA [Psychrobacillus psychrodurans]